MHIDEFRSFQREGATHNVFNLVMTCRRKFLNAARLLELRSDAMDELASFGVDAPVDVWPLPGPFSVLPERYTTQFFSPQENLFQEPSEKQDQKWGKYFHHVLVPQPEARAGCCRTEPALRRDDVAADKAALGTRRRGRLLMQMQATGSEEQTPCT